MDEAHPLDEPLGTVHEAALLLQYWSGLVPVPELSEAMHLLAKGLAEAHEQIQAYAIDTI